MSTLPPDGPQGPEYLEQGGGGPLQPEPDTGSRGGRRTAVVAGGAIVGLLLVGGGIWAATSFFGTGPQPAEALPDSTLGYASIDLDPSGSQKIEAYRMLRKFPALKDKIGTADDDIREKLFDEIQKDANCEGLDYGDDIEPWLGDRAAVAAVDTGEDQPAPVFVVQVKDAGKAEDGLQQIKDCGGSASGDDSGGWAIEGDWAVIAESDKIAQQVADDASKSSLADDEDYQKWTDEVGDAGVVNLYAAPSAGKYLAENLGSMGMFGGQDFAYSCAEDTDPALCEDPMQPDGAAPSELGDALKDFQGMAATIRFDDGALELELAGDPGLSRQGLYGTDRGDDVVASLPDDTAAAVGIGFDEGWFTDLVDQMASYSGGETSAADLMSQLADESGLDLPDDAETLAGESVAVSVGGDFDPETLFNSSDGSDVPIAATVKGDPDAIEGVLDKIRGQMGEEEAILGSDSDGDKVAIGPNSDYRSKVLENGDLGDSEVFKDVVREADRASALLFVNFDAGDDWLVRLASGDQEAEENLKPLEGLGLSAWREDDAAHAVLRLTTN